MSDSRYERPGGWFLLFIMGLSVTVGMNVFNLFSLVGVYFQINRTAVVQQMPYLLTVIQTVLLICIHIKILTSAYQRIPSAAGLIRRCLYLQGLIGIVFTVAVDLLMMRIQPDLMDELEYSPLMGMGLSVLRVLLYTLIWTTYFKYSVRVSVYFRTASEEDQINNPDEKEDV